MRVRGVVGAAALVFTFATAASAAQASFSAHGSVEQVYVTGLDPGAKMALLDRRRRTVQAGAADSLGGSSPARATACASPRAARSRRR